MIYCAVRVERLRKGEDREAKVMLETHNMISFPEGLDADTCSAIVRRNIDGIVGLAMGMANVNTRLLTSYDKLASLTDYHLVAFVRAGDFFDECYKVTMSLRC